MILPPIPYVPRAYRVGKPEFVVWYKPAREYCDEATSIIAAARGGADDESLTERINQLAFSAVSHVDVQGKTVPHEEAVEALPMPMKYELLGAISSCLFDHSFLGK